MEHDFRNAMTGIPQPGDWLENKESKNNEMSRRVWEAVETKVGKVRLAKVKEGRKKDNRCEESSRRVGNLGWRGESSKVGERDKKASSRKIS